MKAWLKSRLSRRQYEIVRALAFEYKRWRCRMAAPKEVENSIPKLHLGCGDRRLQGWLNVDMVGSDLNLDIADGHLPLATDSIELIVCQHVVEHLTMEDELIPLLTECHRVMQPKAVFWIATPDLEKVVRSYVDHRNEDMIADRSKRLAHWALGDRVPPQHFVNDMFYQNGEHRNIFDFELLSYALKEAGFSTISRGSESEMLSEVSDFPSRSDDYQSLYVKAVK